MKGRVRPVPLQSCQFWLLNHASEQFLPCIEANYVEVTTESPGQLLAVRYAISERDLLDVERAFLCDLFNTTTPRASRVEDDTALDGLLCCISLDKLQL